MDKLFPYLLVILIGYVFGCFNLAHWIARRKGVDILNKGSGNPGASNAMVLIGWKAGILVGAHDIGKAALAVWLCGLLFPELPLAREIAGVACIFGHLYPAQFRFRGGKGFASTLGMIAMLNWRFALAVVIATVLLILITDYIVTATAATVVSYPAYCLFTHQYAAAALMSALALLILYKHRENFARILKGTEIGFRRSRGGQLREDGGHKDLDSENGER